MADAQSQLFAQQMQAALQNQQTGVSAATGLGNVGQQGTTAMTTLGQAQQSDPFTAAANYGKIVGGIQAPTTVSNRTQLSPLNTLGSLTQAGSAGYSAIDQALKKYGGIGGVLGRLFESNFTPTGAESMDTLMNPPTTEYTYTDADGITRTGTNDEFYYDRG
jgi:hypothetical protein